MANIVEDIEETIEEAGEALEKVVEKVVDKIKGKSDKNESKKSDKETKVPKKEKELSGKELEKAAKAESKKEVKEIPVDKKKALLEKAKKLSEKLESTSSEDLREQVKAKKKADMLVPLDEYVKAGIYLGTRVVTPDMRPFVYRRRADGLAIFNTDLIDEKLKEGAKYLSQFAPEDIIVACKRQAGWKAAKMFSEITGIKVFAKKYPAGVLTNTNLEDFFENELTVVFDGWVDKNALNDTLNVKKKVLMICDTNNFSKGANTVIIGNNKSARSLGLIFYLLAREYCKARGIEANIPDLEWWTGEKEEEDKLKTSKKLFAQAGAEHGV